MALGLSVSTVSRALNNHPDISKKTRIKVQELARSYKYSPNLFAKGFRTKHTHIIGVIVPDISHYFTTTTVKGILEQGEALGYQVFVAESQNSEQKQENLLRSMTQFGVDGILLSLVREAGDILPITEIMDKVPLVMFDKVSDKVPCSQIVINEVESAFNAVEHLINTGKNRIAFLKESENSYSSNKRLEGYVKAHDHHGLVLDDKLILESHAIGREKGREMTVELLSQQHPPDAIFAVTDDVAIGAIQALNQHQIKIPDEIAVVGFSNSENSLIISPSLSTIDQPGKRIGETAVSCLVAEIESEKELKLPKRIEIATNLVIRESSFRKPTFN